MARLILLDQLRVSVLVPGDLPERQARPIARLVGSARFRRELLRATRAVFGRYPQLGRTRVRLSG